MYWRECLACMAVLRLAPTGIDWPELHRTCCKGLAGPAGRSPDVERSRLGGQRRARYTLSLQSLWLDWSAPRTFTGSYYHTARSRFDVPARLAARPFSRACARCCLAQGHRRVAWPDATSHGTFKHHAPPYSDAYTSKTPGSAEPGPCLLRYL